MNLSDRVWQSTRQLRDEMEVAITAAIGSGTSAASLSRQVRNYKSAVQNAMRVARTETNIAYRRADNARWQQLDFVIGQRVQLSRSHPCPDICDELAGDYPKDFVFEGWHPQCFCSVTPINLDADTLAEIMSHDDWESEMKRIADSKRIKDYPANFKSWVKKNADNIAATRARGTEPYFVRNNAGIIDNILNPDVKPVAQSQGLPQNAHDLIDHLRTNGNLDESYKGGLSERDIYRKWDSLTEDERLQVLERGKYTGMLSTEEDLDFANLYQPASRDNMLGALQDELENKRLGFDVEDTNHYIIKFKGNDTIVHSFDLEKPLTVAQIKRIEYISANAGMSNYRYWAANDEAKSAMMHEMGFIEYCNGVVVDSWNGKDFTGATLPPHYGNAMKLGRAARKRAFELYVDSLPPNLSPQQTAQIRELANELGVDVTPMNFNEADEGRSNIIRDKSNCQSCVVSHEARLRGLNVTAVKYDKSKTSATYQLGERFQDAFVNPKTGNIVEPTKIKCDNPNQILAKLERSISSPGRYVVGYNAPEYGHVFIAEKFESGEIVYYDPQKDEFIEISSLDGATYFELLKIDKMLFNTSFFKKIVSVI